MLHVTGIAAALVSAQRYSNSSSPRTCWCVEYTLVGTADGTATEKKQNKSETRDKRKDKGKSKTHRDSVTVRRFSSTSTAWESSDEARDNRGGVVWYNPVGTAAPAAPALVGGHMYVQQQAAVLVNIIPGRCSELKNKEKAKTKWYWSREAGKRRACAHTEAWAGR